MAGRKSHSGSKKRKTSGFLVWIVAVLGTVVVTVVVSRLLVVPETNEEEGIAAIQVIEGNIQVEVLNSCGVPGVAADATLYLRDHGADVVNTDNGRLLSKSVVLDRVGNIEAARQVAAALGVAVEQVRTEVDSTRYVTVSVFIGKDYQSLNPYKAE